MSGTTRHRLDGLEPDNLLAFMALLGLLRALDTVRPDWRARACWDIARQPLRPMLVVPGAVTPDAVAEAGSDGVARLAAAHRFDRDDLNHKQPEARRLLSEAEGTDGAAVLEALMSDGAVRDTEVIWPTPFCFLFGQGHQHFLSRLHDVPLGVLPARLKGRKPPKLTEARFVRDTLFAPWQRAELTDGFRWDPIEDRRYALRADDPSGDPAGMQHGANALAAIGLPALPGTVVRRRSEVRFLNAGTSYGADGVQITWPIWTVPARLSGIRALLAHPALGGRAEQIAELAPCGVAFAMRAQRISVGKFFNVTLAERVG